MEKTAMQELQEFLHQWTTLDGRSIVCTVEYLNHFITTLLPKERQQIEDSFNSGKRNVFGKTCFLIKDGIDYFTQTYTQK